MIKLNKEYTYEMICEALGWKKTTGEAKKKQIKIIEECFEWYHPENKKTHKPKKSYIFTKQLKEPVLSDNRKSNGSKSLFPDEEFDYLLNCLLKTGFEKNVYFQRGQCNEIYVSSSLIYSEFGFDVYTLLGEIKYYEKDKDIQQLFKNICIDSVKSNSITRICKRFGYKKNSLPKGILRQEGKSGKSADVLMPDNELLPRYNELEKEYISSNECKSIQDAISQGKYLKIINGIQKKFEEEDNKYGVKRYNIISFEGELDFKYDRSKKEKFQEHFKETVLASIEKSVNNRINDTKDYKKKLSDFEKKLMQNYVDQLLGKGTELVIEPEETEEEDTSWLDLL